MVKFLCAQSGPDGGNILLYIVIYCTFYESYTINYADHFRKKTEAPGGRKFAKCLELLP